MSKALQKVKGKNNNTQKKKLCKIVKVFCEGDTEKNYIDELKKHIDITVKIDPIDMKGGGYSNFLNKIKEQANIDCLIRIIIVDVDRAYDNSEFDNLKNLINYCNNENKKYTNDAIPYIIILNDPDFELVACAHHPSYKKQKTDIFIKNILTKQDLDDFKADKNVYTKLNKNDNSYENAIRYFMSRKNYIIYHEYEKIPAPVYIKLNNMHIDYQKIGLGSSNIHEFFDVIKSFQ